MRAFNEDVRYNDDRRHLEMGSLRTSLQGKCIEKRGETLDLLCYIHEIVLTNWVIITVFYIVSLHLCITLWPGSCIICRVSAV